MSQPLKDSSARTSSIHGCSHRLPIHHPHFDRTGGIERCRKGVDQAYGHLGRGTILQQVSLGFKKGRKKLYYNKWQQAQSDIDLLFL